MDSRIMVFCLLAVFASTDALPVTTSTAAPTASPMGQNGCLYLPCAFVSPEFCGGATERSTYWHNDVLCEGCMRCAHHLEGRELNSHQDCEAILCAPLPPTCTLSATREPSQLTDHNGQPCPSCAVCLDYAYPSHH